MDNINVTVQQAFSVVMNFLVAKFMINDVPHALGITGTEHPKTKEESTFPVEARRDLTFCKHMWDLEVIMGRSLTREEIAQKWENWKALRYRPKTDEERKIIHSIKYGNEEVPEGRGYWNKGL